MRSMLRLGMMGLASTLLVGATGFARAETLTIATVNNPDMVVMQKLSPQFTKETGIKLNWVVLPENTLRQRVTTDIATHAGSFDVVTIGTYEAPLWAKAGWLDRIGNLGPSYDMADIFPTVRNALSYNGSLYAVPFYAESSMTYYRKDLFAKAGITMPAQPTYAQIASYADKITDKAHGIYGICLRGLPGWGENFAYLTTLVNTFGGAWFNMNREPQLTTPAWEKAISFYVDLLRRDGPPNATSNGFTELSRCSRPEMRDLDRRDGGRRHAVQPEDIETLRTSSAWRRRRLRLRRTDRIGSGPGLWRFRRPRSMRRRRSGSSPGRHPRPTSIWSRKARAGSRCRPARACPPTTSELSAGRPLRALGRRLDQERRCRASDGHAGALYRRAICRHSRIRGHRHDGRPGCRGRTRRSGERRRRFAAGAEFDAVDQEDASDIQ